MCILVWNYILKVVLCSQPSFKNFCCSYSSAEKMSFCIYRVMYRLAVLLCESVGIYNCSDTLKTVSGLCTAVFWSKWKSAWRLQLSYQLCQGSCKADPVPKTVWPVEGRLFVARTAWWTSATESGIKRLSKQFQPCLLQGSIV